MIKLDVIEINLRHPEWSADHIAEFLGIEPSTVRNVGTKSGLRFAPKRIKKLARQGFKKVRYAGWAGNNG